MTRDGLEIPIPLPYFDRFSARFAGHWKINERDLSKAQHTLNIVFVPTPPAEAGGYLSQLHIWYSTQSSAAVLRPPRGLFEFVFLSQSRQDRQEYLSRFEELKVN